MAKKFLTLIITIVLFGISLFLPVFRIEDFFGSGYSVVEGYKILIYGWYAFYGFHFAWLANVAWAIAIILFLKGTSKYTIYFIFAAIVLSFDSYFFPSKYYIGFYFWNASMYALLLLLIPNLKKLMAENY